ncbi:MAG: GNAT family N-acetyltransferase [Actinomycetota bacterium]
MTYRVEALDDDHDLQPFDCGNDPLNEWLKRHARHATGQGTRTYVLVDERTGGVVGYFAIAPHLVEREEMPSRIGRGAPRRIPGILLAKLALDRDAQGCGLGGDLLVRALEMIVEGARVAGGKLVVVDAVDEAATRFYEHHDFDAVPGNPSRLVRKLSTVATALRLPWP